MPKTVRPFKLGTTSDTLTPHAGLALVGEFTEALGLAEAVDRELPAPGSAAGYRPAEYVIPLILMLHGGGRTLEDLREVWEDEGLRRVLGLAKLPSADAVGDWLRRMGEGGGLGGLAAVNRELLRWGMKEEKEAEYTLDIDATQIVAEKREARRTYKGERGYMPIVGHLGENGLVVGEEFRAGNVSPGAGNLGFIEHCAGQLPEGARIAHLRSDSAAYQASILNWCEDQGVSFAIGADLDAGVKGAIAAIGRREWRGYGEGWIAETVHSMEATRQAFRLVVISRPVQGELFDKEDPRLRYTVMASNREETAEETVGWYNQRGEASENRIKELKIGFGMERMPCGQQWANAVFFRIGVLAYNLFVLLKKMGLPPGWDRHQVQTVRWRLYQTAGKVVRHAGSLLLKIGQAMYGLFEEVRRRCYEVARA